MTNIVWFEIPATNLQRAKRFYESVFGFPLQRVEMAPATMERFPDGPAGGASGALIQTEGYVPSHAGSLVYFAANDIDASLASIERAGGRTLIPKLAIGEAGFIAHFQDSEGNRIGLHALT